MRGLVFLGPRKLAWRQMPDPAPGEGEVIVATRAVGICGSDIHGYTGENPKRHPGNCMGHEATGQVVALGQGVPGTWLGRRVAMYPTLACGRCDQCRGGHDQRCRNRRFMGNNAMGAMAEKVSLPVSNLYPLPDRVSYVHAALTEPLAVALHAVRQAGAVSDRSVLIAGGGPIGLLTLVVARAMGARAVALTVRTPARRELAMTLGASVAVDPTREGWREEVARVLGTAEVDVAFEAAGIQPTFDQCMETVARGGTVVVLGSWGVVQLDLKLLSPREIHLVGTLTYTAKEFGEALDLLSDGKVDPTPLVTEQRPLSDGATVFEELTGQPSRALRVILTSGS